MPTAPLTTRRDVDDRGAGPVVAAPVAAPWVAPSAAPWVAPVAAPADAFFRSFRASGMISPRGMVSRRWNDPGIARLGADRVAPVAAPWIAPVAAPWIAPVAAPAVAFFRSFRASGMISPRGMVSRRWNDPGIARLGADR